MQKRKISTRVNTINITEPAQAELLTGLSPVIDDRCRVLILGSFPSAISLARQEYYANPRNDFWRIMEAVIGMPTELPYDERLRFLLNSGIGLWDVITRCKRQGSADSAIRDPTMSDIRYLLARYPGITLLACNGRSAEAGLNRILHLQNLNEDQVTARYLPSSSPANAIRFTEKIRAWQILRLFLETSEEQEEPR
jgi:double-stranded uracil-DNA glycosylase